VTQRASRVAEVVSARREFSKTYRLSDGRLEVEIGTVPLHYRDASGRWRDVDTRVAASDRDGFGHRSRGGNFTSWFGNRSDRLVRFEMGHHSLTLGVPGTVRNLRPNAAGSRLTFPDVFGTADVRYTVGATSLKEDVVLSAPPTDPTYSFELKLGGLDARQQPDGSIGFFSRSDPETPLLRMPKPFMTDSAVDRGSPTGSGYSDQVTQSINRRGDTLLVTLRASETWLRDARREYPVTIDPTVEVVPTDSTGSQDALIISSQPSTNYGNNLFIDAGAYSNDKRRSLLKFNTSMIPRGTPIDSAHLQVHFDTTLDGTGAATTIEARPVTAPWDESTVTWNSINTALSGSAAYNLEQVDDEEVTSVAAVGNWPTSNVGTPNGSSYHYNKDAVVGDTFTWYPDLTEDGDYRVDVWYTAGADRSTAAPFTINHGGGATTYNVNQTTGGGTWKTLGTHRFTVGGNNKVTLRDVSGGLAVVADAVRFVKGGFIDKPAGVINGTHSFPVRSAVQSWVNASDPAGGYGIALKLPAASEGVGTIGPRYLSSEGGREVANGDPSVERAVLPKLIVRYDRASVDLAEPKKVASTGASLSWSEVPDPRADSGDVAVGYQVHRQAVDDPQADQYFTPSNATLVASLSKDESSFTDTTAEPNKGYYYRVAALTKDGELAPSRTVHVTTPAAGRVVQVVQGDISDTTLSSATPTVNHNVLDGLAKLNVGNSHSTYGNQRAVMKFDTSVVPSNAKVLDADLLLWKRLAAANAPTAEFALHRLTRSFVETQATWNQAATGSTWTAGGAYDATALAISAGGDPWPARVRWRGTNLTNAAQDWVRTPSGNYGLLLKYRDEASTVKQRLEIWSGEYAPEPELRPQLVLEYLDPDAATFYAPDTPQRMIPNTRYTVPVTVTNTTNRDMPAGLILSYVWTYPDGSEVINAGTPGEAVLPAMLAPGQSTTLNVPVMPPVNSETGNKRRTYYVNWDLKAGTTWLSTDPTWGISRYGQPVAVEDPVPHDANQPTHDAWQLGMEKFFQYGGGTGTGTGSGAMVNLRTGNVAWTYAPISIPSLGPSAFVRLTYNSLDGTSSQAGYGVSLQTSTLTRNGSPLMFQNVNNRGYPAIVSIIDGDGTSHAWVLNENDSNDPAQWTYETPAGVHLALRQNGGNATGPQAWVITRPDGTKFYFDELGYQTSVRDPNGNQLTFAYDLGTTKRLRTLTDTSGRVTLSLDYDTSNRVRTITDISGRTLTFNYDTAGKLDTLTDAAGTQSKVFRFTYSTDSTNENIRLASVQDPRASLSERTLFSYIDSPTDSYSHGRLRTITNRLGKVTTFTYSDLDGEGVDGVQATVTDANQHTTTYTIDNYGRPKVATNAKGEVTRLVWDADNNVSRLVEANGAVTTWTYDPDTGYPLTVTDAQQNRTSAPRSMVLSYNKFTDADAAKVAWLTQRTTPQGDSWQFQYDSYGNVTRVTDPGNNVTRYEYEPSTPRRLLKKIDARQYVTTYSKIVNGQVEPDYHASGYPQTITDALGNAATFEYDVRGNVTKVSDPNLKAITQTYDGFGRPLVNTTPIDTATNRFATTTVSYDLNDNVTQVIGPNGGTAGSTYNAGDQLIEQTFPTPTTQPRKVTYTYDPVGNLLTTVDPQGNVSGPTGHTTRYAYDEIDQAISKTDAKGGVTRYSYDNVGNLVKIEDPIKSASADPNDFTVRYGYDRAHRQVTVTDPAGHVMRTRYDVDGQVASKVDADGNITTLTRDSRGLVTQVRAPYDVEGPNTDYLTTGFAYDQVGNRTRVIQPRGMATSTVDDYTEVVEYDALNRPTRRTLPNNGTETPATISHQYDSVGNLTAVSEPTTIGAATYWTRYTHFDNGWIKTSTDPFGIETQYNYNELGQQESRTFISAAGNSKREMTWSYNRDGSLSSRSDLGAPAGVSEVLTDNSDQRATAPVGTWPVSVAGTGYWGYNYQTHAAGTGASSFTWDLTVPKTGSYEVKVRYPQVTGAATNAQFTVNHAAGSSVVPVNQTTNAGTWVSLGTYSFSEGVGKSVKLTDAANGTVVADAVLLVRNDPNTPRERRDLSYTYDVNGNLTAVDNSSSAGASDYTVAYDELNRPTRITEDATAGNTTTDYTYDPVGRPDTVTINQLTPLKDQFYDYTWDTRGLLASVMTGETASDPAAKTTTYGYDNRGLRASEVKGNRNRVSYSYYDHGLLRLSREVKPDGHSLVAEHDLGYDADGNRTRDTAKVLNSDTRALDSSVTTYTYDARNRVTGVTRTGTGAVNESYTYDAASNITRQVIGGVTTDFVYDRNRLQKATVGTSASLYNYDPFGRLDTITAGGAVAGRYVYDGFDRQVEQRTVTSGATKVTRSTYDAWDRLATKTDTAGKTTAYSYIGLSSQLLAELDKDQNRQKAAYTFDAYGQRLTQTTHKTDGTTENAWYGYNPHTDVETLTTSTGDTKSTYGYTAYGKDRTGAMSGADKPGVSTEPYNVYRYNAKRWDSASGDYDMGFRTYNPGLNRFTTRDMYNGALSDLGLGLDPWNVNRYAFAGGNPISRVELDGHCAVDPEGSGCVKALHPHAAAVYKTRDAAYEWMQKNNFQGRVTVDPLGHPHNPENKVPGSGKKGGDGWADVIIWGEGKDSGVIYVYEVKAANQSEADALNQLMRYIDGLREKHPDKLVLPGPHLAAKTFNSAFGQGRVWSGTRKRNSNSALLGLRWYGTDGQRQPSVRPSSQGKEQEEKRECRNPLCARMPIPEPGSPRNVYASGDTGIDLNIDPEAVQDGVEYAVVALGFLGLAVLSQATG